ncbi:TetR/AcrR family transcriptional regulator [Streptomyces lasiicapitis]|uniref:TetR/AcrR family transcriptional regulator n=1 Tax=Streptomyces lasiicapitis TaxID=1923961 RepID=UPI00369DC050
MRTRATQADRSARSRTALLESAARGLSRHGYGHLKLEQVAREAGYTRGALYHQFKDKLDLTLAVCAWFRETYWHEVARHVEQEPEPVAALLTLARGHAVFCRRDVARVPIALRLEFSGQDHPVGREVERNYETLLTRCAGLIDAGRAAGTIPPGRPTRARAVGSISRHLGARDSPPPRGPARQAFDALEGTVIALAGQAPDDELFAARAVAGVLGLAPPS